MMPALKCLARKLVNLVSIWTITQLILLWLAIGVTAWGLVTVLPLLRGTGFWWIGFWGVLLGYLLARSRLPGWVSAFLLPTLGSLLLLLTIGRLVIPLKTLLSALATPAGQNSAYTRGLVEAWRGIEGAVAGLVTRFRVTAISGGRLTNDAIMTALLLGLVLWLVAGWAAWWIGRRTVAVPGLLPAAVLLTCSIYYYNNLKSIFFLVLLGGTIMLLEGVSGFAEVSQRWQKNRLDQAEDVQPEITINIIGAAVLLMAVGWMLASIPVEKITDNIQKYLEARRNGNPPQTFSPGQNPSAPMTILNRFPSFDTTVFNIEGYPKLSNQIVMYVSVEGYQPRPEVAQYHSQVQDIVPPYYWRTLTYNKYDGYGWYNSIYGTSDYQPGYALPPGQSELSAGSYQLVRQHVQYAGKKGGTVITAGQLITLDQSYYVYWRSPEDLISAQTEAFAYIADSRLPMVTVSQLRQAGTNYPVFLNKYLQLPEELPSRVRNQVLDLTATQPTPYDQVIAIQTYLRSFPYTLNVPAPPLDRDITDFFLFDLKKGYCDYYATAMAVMARVIGIPTRLVTGFSTGLYDEQTGSFIVTTNNAHAWVEVYFPGIGWVEFEPTAGLPAIERPGSTETTSHIAPPVSVAKQGGNTISVTSAIKSFHGSVLIFATAFAVLLFILSFSADRLILLLRPADRAVTNIYRRIYRLGSCWFAEMPRARTPHEFAAELSTRLVGQYKKGYLPPTLIAARTELAWLTDLYNRTLYSPCLPTRLEHRRAVQTWFRLRRHLSWLRFEKTIAFRKKHRRN